MHPWCALICEVRSTFLRIPLTFTMGRNAKVELRHPSDAASDDSAKTSLVIHGVYAGQPQRQFGSQGYLSYAVDNVARVGQLHRLITGGSASSKLPRSANFGATGL